jgi:hypothetical protein
MFLPGNTRTTTILSTSLDDALNCDDRRYWFEVVIAMFLRAQSVVPSGTKGPSAAMCRWGRETDSTEMLDITRCSGGNSDHISI